jgi:hypothetical protein
MTCVFDGTALAIGSWITYGTQTSNMFRAAVHSARGNRSPTSSDPPSRCEACIPSSICPSHFVRGERRDVIWTLGLRRLGEEVPIASGRSRPLPSVASRRDGSRGENCEVRGRGVS